MSTTLPSDKAVHLFRRAEVRWAQRLHHRKRNDKEGKWHIFWFVGFWCSVSLLLLTRRLAVCKELRRCNHLDDQRSRYHIGRFPTTCVCRICGTTIRALFSPDTVRSPFIYNGGVGTQTGYIYMELDTYIQPIGGVMLRLLRASAMPRTEKAPSAAIVRIMSFLI